MKVTKIMPVGSWNRALNMARETTGKPYTDKEPSDKWKKRMLLCEHSPIRDVIYDIWWEGIKMRISVHFVRHNAGYYPFVQSQRDDHDLTIKDSDALPQGEPNNMSMSVNAQEILYISQKRLCTLAGKDTINVWKKTLEALKEYDPILVSKCVPTCIYRGFCPEFKSCGYANTEEFKKRLIEYRKVE